MNLCPLQWNHKALTTEPLGNSRQCILDRIGVCASSVVPDSLRPHGLWPTRLLCPWDFPGKNTGLGCHFLLQNIFPTQGLNPGLLHCRRILYHLPPGKPKNPGVGNLSLLQEIFPTRVSTSRVDSLPAELPGRSHHSEKPAN